MKETVWISKQPGATVAHVSCFEARQVVKALPVMRRRWDQTSKTWLVHVGVLDQLAVNLHAAGFRVMSDIKDSGALEKPTGSWAMNMYTALGRDLGDQAYKQLVRVLHPDAGGDAEAMKELNRARDEYRAS